MALTSKVVPRTFKYNGVTIPDPDPSLTPEQVRDLLSAMYPEITASTTDDPVLKNGVLEYTFQRQVGTKG